MYPHSTAVSICQSGIVVLVLFSYPLQLHPARASLDKFLFPSPITPSTSSTPTRALSEADASDSGEESTLSPVEDHVEEEIPLGRFIIESSVILFSTFVIAMFVSSLETVLGFVGATGSTTISFILPSLFCEYHLLSSCYRGNTDAFFLLCSLESVQAQHSSERQEIEVISLDLTDLGIRRYDFESQHEHL